MDSLQTPDTESNGCQYLIPCPVTVKMEEGSCKQAERVRVHLGRRAFRRKVASLPAWAQEEAYQLQVKRTGVHIDALTETGVFRARTTLEQLSRHGLPCCTILDYPRFRHRGLMIDESRSFKGLDFLKKQVDAMVLLKLNVLHLHLTDAAGWRLEIPAARQLTERAAWRIGRTYAEWEAAGYPFASADDPQAYGGYYTAAQMRELVAYAAGKQIRVIPEIEMPGHSMEVNRACPEIACVGEDGRSRTFAWDLCPGNEGTFRLLEAVLDEVMAIFPSEYIHIGGDEAVMKDWPLCVNCRRRMQEEGFTEVRQLQGYLVRRMEAYLRSHGRTAIGWDELLETGVPSSAVIQSWRGMTGGIKAAAAGHPVILSPTTHCYYDYYQDLIRKEPLAVGALTSLRHCYHFAPEKQIADSLVLGIQANLWCEKIPTTEHAEYMLYPRLFSLAENAWSPAANKDWKRFYPAARALADDFRTRGYNTFDMDTESELARSGWQTFEDFEKHRNDDENTD